MAINLKKAKKLYVLYDGRYLNDPEEASVYEVCDTLKEARESAELYGDDTVIVRYDEDSNNKSNLINAKIVK